jgi:hypothetical protein
MIRAAHAYWAACAGAGLDQVIDDVWLVPEQPAGLEDALPAANTLWVGVRCPLATPSGGNESVAIARWEPRAVITAWCTRSRTTTWRSTPRFATSEECAQTILATLDARPDYA